MGLDTSHDAWHGSYSAFHRFRAHLVYIAWGPGEKGDIEKYVGYGGDLPLPKNDALVTLVNHSDCDGEILLEECGPLADRLEELLSKMEPRALYDDIRPAIERFITGLRRAVEAGEPLDFH